MFIQLVGDSRMNHLEEKGDNMIQARSISDFDVKCTTIQFYGNNHNSQSYHWISLKFYVESPDMLSYLGLKYHVNQCSSRHPNGSTKVVRVLLFTSFLLVNFLFV